MRCAKAQRNLGRYLDKELINKKTLTLIENHLQSCSHCKAELNSLIFIKDLISQKEKLTAGDDFLLRLQSKLKPETLTTRIRRVVETGTLARRLIPVPVAIMILVTALMLGRQNSINPLDDYMFGDLSNTELGILNGEQDNSDLLTKTILKNQGGNRQ